MTSPAAVHRWTIEHLVRALVLGGLVFILAIGAVALTGFDGSPASVWPATGVIVAMAIGVFVARALASERNGIREAIAQSERLFLRLAETSPSGTIHFDRLGRPTFADHRWTVLTGVDHTILDGDRWLEAIAPADRSAANSLWSRARATLEPCSGEYLFCNGGEPAGYAELNLYPEVENGTVLGFAARLTDVTARRRTEDVLQERETRYRLVTENAQDVIVCLGLDGRPRYVSDTSLRVTGYAPVELVARPLTDLIHGDDVPMFKRSLARMAEGITEPSIEFRLRRRDGHFSWFESSQRVTYDREGHPIEIVAALRNIERRRRAEATAVIAATQLRETSRLLMLAEELAGVGHWRFDPRERALDYSPQVNRILKQQRDDRLLPERILGLFHDDDRRDLLLCLARTRRTPGTAECIIRLKARDGPRHVRLVAEARYQGDEFIGWFGVVGDDTDKAAAEVPTIEQSARANTVRQVRGGEHQRNILMAEDDPVNQMLIAAIVRRMGHALTVVETGRQAVAAAAAEHFDVILMDMQMPEMDGLAATRAIRASTGPCAKTMIIALIADASPERRRFYDGAGFSHFLTKPVDRQALAASLAAIGPSRGRRTNRELAASAAPALVEPQRIAELRKVLGSDRLEALLGLLIADCLDRPAQLRTALCRGELMAIRAEGYGLKGAALSVGATALGEAAERLEAVATLALAEPLVAALEECAQATRTAVLRLLDSPTDDRASA